MSDSGQQTASGEALQLFFSAIIDPGCHEGGLQYGFCRVRLRFLSQEKNGIYFNNRLGSDNDIEIAGAKLSVRGKEHMPEWYLSVSEGALDGEYASRSPLCEIAGGKIGDKFSAELSVRPEDGALCSAAGCQLPEKIKKVIIERLYAKRLKDHVDSQGWLSLGLQRLQIVRADNHENRS